MDPNHHMFCSRSYAAGFPAEYSHSTRLRAPDSSHRGKTSQSALPINVAASGKYIDRLLQT
jgi:hypothetical protein